MPDVDPFFDSNVVLYMFSADEEKANRVERLLESGGVISVQVLNEVTNVMRRKMNMSWDETNEAIELICELCEVQELTIKVNQKGREIAERYGLPIYDSMIVAAALLANCDVLYSEDMQNGLMIEDRLEILDPF